MERNWWDDRGQAPVETWTTEDPNAPLNSTFSPHSHSLANNTLPDLSESAFVGGNYVERIPSCGPMHYKQAIECLQHYPRSFVHAWLLLAKSLGMTMQRVNADCHSESALSIDELGAIATLKDLPHDQILAWYRDDVTHLHTRHFNSAPSKLRRIWDVHTGEETEAVDHCNHSTSATCRSSTCSSVCTKRSSTRPSSTSSITLSDPSFESQAKEQRTSKRLRPSTMGDLPEESELVNPQEVEKPLPYIYRCTGCSKAFKSMQTWSRHEKEDHEDISFPCMPNGAIGFTKYGRECAFCGQEPTEEHLRSHNIEQCTQLKHVFKRSYELKQHLEAHGVAKESKLSKMLVTMWQRKPDKQAWACGFCKGLFSSLPEFHKHIATQHYERGETREWDHTKVILGLLSQPRIAALWHRLLVTRFKVQSLSCKWKKSRTRELQLRLELGQEPGDVLALAALDCAAYDHGLLHEVYRRSDTWTSTSDTSTTFGALGPPVPPKPLASRPSSQEQSSSKTRNTDEKRATEISPSDRFKTPSPQLFDSSLHGTDIHAEYPTFSSEDILHDLNRDNLADLGDPIDIDMEWQTDYSSQLHFPLEETQDFQDTWIGARSPELQSVHQQEYKSD